MTAAVPTSIPSSRLPQRRDVVLAALFAVATSAAAGLYSQANSGSRSLDVAGVLLITLIAGSIALRQWPLAALAAGVAAVVPYHLLEYPPEVVLPAVMVLLYTVAVTGTRFRTVAAGLVVAAAVLLSMRFSDGGWPGNDAVDAVGWLVAALAFGQAIQSQRAYTAAVEERAVRAEHTREQEALRRVAEERLRIARDLHDVMAHNIAVIGMQSSVAAYLIDERDDDDPRLAELSTSLHHIADAGGVALSELRTMLDVLRGSGADSEERTVVPSLDRLAGLITSAHASGVAVDVCEVGDRRALPVPVDVAAYRIIQEALTNVGKHARGAPATVTIDYRLTDLCIRVADHGNQQPGPDITYGHGLTGMTERAHAVGGTVSVGPRPDDGGFSVEAVLPTTVQPPRTDHNDGALS